MAAHLLVRKMSAPNEYLKMSSSVPNRDGELAHTALLPWVGQLLYLLAVSNVEGK